MGESCFDHIARRVGSDNAANVVPSLIHNNMVVGCRRMSIDIFASRISFPWSLNLYTDA